MKREPIAIIGMACRFPGGCQTPEAFWKLLVDRTDAITEVEDHRWSIGYYYHPNRNAPGKTYTRAGGQIDGVFDFEPEFFGISPREAKQMDPQQRMLLELTWEALEDGGQIPDALKGSDCSVYIGISSTDYGTNQFDDLSSMDGYGMTGNTQSIAANRISYIFDLRGPSMAIDTACSSSLVALHQACGSIWHGESSASIIGAVQLLLSPSPYVGFSKASMLSPNGRCRVFDAEADGYVRSEGGAVLFLKPLSRAQADGDRIHALILGTHVNSDGHNAALTIPNGDAQKALLRSAYKSAAVPIERVEYIEAHGTGTPVGDPVEARAIGEVVGALRDSEHPILIGSVKSNIGHLEPASGIAGLLKVILSLEHRGIPASIHFRDANPEIDFAGLNLKLVDEFVPLNGTDTPVIMGVNSFGFGGSNAHAILADYRDADAPREEPAAVPEAPLILSAYSQTSLRRRAEQFAQRLRGESDAARCYELLATAALRRQMLPQGLAVYADSGQALAARLEAFGQGKEAAGVVTGERLAANDRVAFVFSGNGSQWPGMARDLLKVPTFRRAVEELDACLQPLSKWSLFDELQGEPDGARMALTEIAQPLLFAVQLGLVRMLAERGVRAEAVLGHSVGEIAAAYVSGALTLEQAAAVLFHRSSAQGRTRGAGKMLAARVTPADAQALLADAERIELAAANSPHSVTFVGPEASIERLAAALESQGVFNRILNLDYAFHSAAMDKVKASFLASLGAVALRDTSVDFVSTVTGRGVPGQALDTAYWWDNIRRPVLFGAAVSHLIERGFGVFLEIGPHAVLQTYMHECLQESAQTGVVIPTLKRNADDEVAALTEAALKVHIASARTDRGALFPLAAPPGELPPYPWNRAEYRVARTAEAVNRISSHRLLGCRLSNAEYLWHNHIDIETHPLLADHVVDGVAVYPAAAFAEMALAASREVFERELHEVAMLEIRKPMVFEADLTREVELALSREDLSFTIKSRPRLSGQAWTLHALGTLIQSPARGADASHKLAQIQANAHRTLDAEGVYAAAAQLNLSYGPAFRGVQQVWIGDGEALSRITVPAAALDGERYCLHPVIIDSAFHTLLCTLETAGAPMVPIAIGRLVIRQAHPRDVYCLARIHHSARRSLTASFTLLDPAGNTLGAIDNCTFKQLPRRTDLATLPAYYECRRIPKNHIDPAAISPLPSLEDLAAQLRDQFAGSELAGREAGFANEILPLYDALAAALAERTLSQLGAHLEPFTVQSLLIAAGIPVRHAAFVTYLLLILQEDGKAVFENGAWRLLADEESDDAVDIWRAILADHPACLADMLETSQVGFRLLNWIARGEDAEDAAGDHPSLLNDGDPLALSTALVHFLVHKITQTWPRQRRRLRIAEVHGRGSAPSKHLLGLLPKAFCDYQILALNEDAAARFEYEFASYPHVKVDVLDASKQSLQQHFKQAEFDVLIVNHWLHECDDILKALGNLAYLIAAGGLLLLTEKSPDRLTDINRGVDPTWWSRALHDEQPASRLMHAEEWLLALEKAGFSEATVLSDPLCGNGRHYLIGSCLPPRAQEDKESPEEHKESWLILADRSDDSNKIAALVRENLAGRGDRVHIAFSGDALSLDDGHELTFDPGEAQHLAALAAHLHEQDGGCDGVIYLLGMSLNRSTSGKRAAVLPNRACLALAHLVEAFDRSGFESSPRLWLVTTGAVTTRELRAKTPGSVNPNQAPLWGMGRVLKNEYPHLDCRMLDLDTGNNLHKAARAIVTEVRNVDEEDEIIVVDDARYALRIETLDPASRAEDAARNRTALAETGYRLGSDQTGSIDRLAWMQCERRAPGAGEIEIEVNAAGLNFRDVMYAAGLLPDEMLEGGLAGATLGLECAGSVTRTGAGVEDYREGDEVICFAPACFASHVLAPSTTVIRKPAAWTYAEAATIPTAFFTAYYALHYLARLRPGESVLIHGAAGGVGLAAIQIARHLGAEIYATAGTDAKRRFLEQLGVEHVLNSRTLEFADRIMDITAGRGIDVVLNSLAGEAIDKNLSVLRPCGRFLELGKRDFLENRRLGLRPFRHNIAYFGIDADELMAQRPDLCRQIFDELMSLFDVKALRPIAHSVFAAEDVRRAFGFMQHSQHIGKIVVSLAENCSDIVRSRGHAAELRLAADASYLVTGGLSGFGLATARWMADKGARNLILLGRSGARSQEAVETIEALEGRGVNVEVARCDVADPVALQKVLREIRDTAPPLRGIVHAAMVLHDCTLRNLTEENLSEVMKPKIQGAWNLHQLTLDLPLDFFIMYSSATTYVGNPGQANYVAANLYLEALARFRDRLGRPATVIAWDAITDAGVLTRDPSLRESLAHLGINGMTTAQAFAALEQLLSCGVTEAAVMNANWKSVKKYLPIAKSPRFTYVTQGITIDDALDANKTIKDLIEDLSRDEIHILIGELLVEEISEILHIPVERIEHHKSFQEMGLDSLMAMELVTAVDARFGVDIPVMALSDNTTVDTLTKRITGLLTAGETPVEEVSDEDTAMITSIVVTHERAMSQQDVESIARELKQADSKPRRIIQ